MTETTNTNFVKKYEKGLQSWVVALLMLSIQRIG